MKLKIVLVEDSLDLASSFEDAFSLEGHSVKYFLTGREALENPQVIQQADIVVSDYYLPDINGVEVISGVRKLNSTVPVLLLSGAREPEVLNFLKTLPCSGFLSKPVDLDDLEKKIFELVYERQAA